ncbi:MAG: hypothetical protein U5K38_14690 [Woeseiaceae bacterium]|nr:hypothetical protein [Woeseiaceae bacterium]
MKILALFSIALLATALPVRAVAIDTDRADVQAFIEDMVSMHGYDRARLMEVLN